MIVFGINWNLFIVLPIRFKICRSYYFFFFTRQNVCPRKIGCISEVLYFGAFPIGIGRAICWGLYSPLVLPLFLVSFPILSNFLYLYPCHVTHFWEVLSPLNLVGICLFKFIANFEHVITGWKRGREMKT